MRRAPLLLLAVGALVTVVCGSAGSAAAAAPAPSALQPEATATAAGDIPDNQVFIGFSDAGAGYSLKYPEGWAQQGSGATVTFRDKNNIVRVVVRKGAAASTATIKRELATLAGAKVQRARRR
ncbi:MAG: PsbP-related protein [Gemmatimonadales bacterium]